MMPGTQVQVCEIYPILSTRSHWHGVDNAFGEQSMFVTSEMDAGIKLDFMCFANAVQRGRGIYDHFLTMMISYVNLVTRITSNPPP
jgi:hypothetical protein